MHQALALIGALVLVGGGGALTFLLQDLWPLPSERTALMDTLRFAAPLLTMWASLVAMFFALAAYAKPAARVTVPAQAAPPEPPATTLTEEPKPYPDPWYKSLEKPQPQQPQVVVVRQGSGGNVLAALLTVLIPGLGHLCQGRILSAIGLVAAAIFVFVIAAASKSGMVLLVGIPLVYLAAIVDCAAWDPSKAKSALDRL